VAIDARYEKEEWCVYSKGGRLRTERELYTWALEVGERGAGEILFTSMDHDGTNRGFACEAIARLSGLVNVPVIASGGAGKLADFNEVFTKGKADAALAAVPKKSATGARKRKIWRYSTEAEYTKRGKADEDRKQRI
jgi:cyclase